MESIFSYICEHAHHAPWIIFLLLLLAGLGIPISEDVLLLGAGALASTCIPDHTLRLFTWIFLGCILSAWETYWIGRLLGPKLYEIRFFKLLINPHYMGLLSYYYAKFGIFTFIVGRFFPGGIRNALFLSSGITKMPFPLFALRDGIACFISTNVLFHLGYKFGQNLDTILFYFDRYTEWFLAIIGSLLLIGGVIFWYLKKKDSKNHFD